LAAASAVLFNPPPPQQQQQPQAAVHALPPAALISLAHAAGRLGWPCGPLLAALLSLAADEGSLAQVNPRGVSMLAWAAAMQLVLLNGDHHYHQQQQHQHHQHQNQQPEPPHEQWQAGAHLLTRCVLRLAQTPGALEPGSLSRNSAAQLHQARVLLAVGVAGQRRSSDGDGAAAGGAVAAAAAALSGLGPGHDAATSLELCTEEQQQQQQQQQQQVEQLLARCRAAWDATHRLKAPSATQRSVCQVRGCYFALYFSSLC
jgi:hypothetical protein